MSITYSTLQNALFPAGTTTPQTLRKSSDGILLSYGKSVPVDGVGGYAPGCIFIDINGTAGNVVYINDGTATSCDFNPIKQVPDAYGTAGGQGPSPAIWQEVDVLDLLLNPQHGFYYFDDFLGPHDPATTEGWVVTATDVAAPAAKFAVDATEQGGVLKVQGTGDTPSADDGIEAQMTNCLFKPASGVKIYFEARVKMSDATQQYVVGLAGIDTTLMAAGVLDDVVDKCVFYHEAASTDNKISACSARLTSEEKDVNVADNTDATYMKVGFIIDGLTRVDYYVNGVNVGNCIDASDIPNAVMCLSLVAKYEGAAGNLSVDWVRIAQVKTAGGGRA